MEKILTDPSEPSNKLYHNSSTLLGNKLEQALNKINRQDIVDKCICNVELVTDDMEKAVAKVQLDQSGFESLKDELGPSRDTSLRRDMHLDKSYQDGSDTIDNSETDIESEYSVPVVYLILIYLFKN